MIEILIPGLMPITNVDAYGIVTNGAKRLSYDTRKICWELISVTANVITDVTTIVTKDHSNCCYKCYKKYDDT